MSDAVKVLGENRKARHNYHIEDTLECGIVLVGTEVKSIRAGHFAFNDAYAQIENGELWLRSFHITAFKQGTFSNHLPDQPRKLLAHREQIDKLRRKTDEKGYTLVPLQLHLKKGHVKVLIGLGKGKKLFDKRETIKERDEKRDRDRDLRLKA